MKRYRRPKNLIHEQRLSQLEEATGKENPLSRDLSVNETKLREAFENCADVIFRKLKCNDALQREVSMLVIYVDGLVDTTHLDESVLKILMRQSLPNTSTVSVAWVSDLLAEHAVPVAQVETVTDLKNVISRILKGNIALLVDGDEAALIAGIIGWDRRAIDEPPSEPVIRGPREGFIENLRTNTALVRRRIRSSRLKMENMTIGDLSQTDVTIGYIEGITNPSIVDEVRKRLARIKIDAVLESAFLEEFIEDEPLSPFPQVESTERPDIACADLLEGKVAIFTDGTPFVLLAPTVFWGSLNANEDYYHRTFMSSFLRISVELTQARKRA